ncbi:sensor histidine kinase [Saccharopolyspora taberi]|uniref:histidine kinase n=1 Tax=Saccharopolyspora taberi TaxID=60895 RepID=A0ABN3VNZ8_9PSEU
MSISAKTPSSAPGIVRRLRTLLREQWIFAAALGTVLLGELLLLVDSGARSLLVYPGLVVMAVLALLARRWPVLCGFAGAFVLAANSALIHLIHFDPYSFGLAAILLTENIAGVALVLTAFWRTRKRYAIPVTALLVLSCLGSIHLRTGSSLVIAPEEISRAIGAGFLELVLAIGTGLYLRGTQPRSDDTPLQALVRRQWPVIAVLFVFLFLDLISMGAVLPAVVVLLGGGVLSVLAVLAPTRPVEAPMLGAAAVALMAVTMRLIGAQSDTLLLGPIRPTVIAAGMILLAFSTRYAPPRKAVWSGAALVVSALFAMTVTPGDENYDWPSDALTFLFMGGLLLVLAVGTGVYFRARDNERARTVETAVSSAQQAERMALARELHDVVAHHVTGIVVQAQAAQMVAEKNPQAATDALARIADSGTEALTAMRRLVASMRGAEPAGASKATEQATTNLEADLAALIEGARRHGADTEAAPNINLRVDIGRQIPQEVARSALRVVQESLTNSRKHAFDVSQIEIDVDVSRTHLRTRVTDDGSGSHARPVGGSGGYGLVGMRERVELLGGRFNAGPGDHVGWRVEAWLPLGEQNEQEDSR